MERIVSDLEKSESVGSGLRDLLSRHNNLGLDTYAEHVAYEGMLSDVILAVRGRFPSLFFVWRGKSDQYLHYLTSCREGGRAAFCAALA